MPDTKTLATHYARDSLFDDVKSGMADPGLNRDTVSIEELGPVDEFHIGGRIETKQFWMALPSPPTTGFKELRKAT